MVQQVSEESDGPGAEKPEQQSECDSDIFFLLMLIIMDLLAVATLRKWRRSRMALAVKIMG